MKKILFLYIISSVSAIYSQILKDTTLPYGVFSTKYYQEKDDKYFNNKRYAIDTTFMKYQNYDGALTKNNFYQNLGVMGSASRLVFYDVNREIGFTAGYNAFRQFFNVSEDVVYYDTRSPFSQINYIQGTTGENALKLNLSAPITKKFNFGIDIGRFTSRKIAGRTGNKETDKLNSNFNLGLYLNYLSKNQRYKIFGNSTLAWHNQGENGGFNLKSYQNKDVLFDSLETATTNLANDRSYSNLYRNDVRLYQNYRLSKDSLIGLFHEFSFQRCSTNVFLIPEITPRFDSVLNAPAFFDRSKTIYTFRFDKLENKIGIAGLSKMLDYVLFIDNRRLASNLLVTGKLIQDDTSYLTKVQENYVGGDLKFKFLKDKLLLNAYAESKLNNTVKGYQKDLFEKSLKKDYVLDLSISAYFAKVGFLQKSTSPSYFQTHIHHNNFRWSYPWDKPIVSSNLYLQLEKTVKRQYLALNLYSTSLQNYLYLDSSRSIARDTQNIQLLRASITANLSLWKFHLDNRIELASSSNEAVYSVPSYIYAPKIYFGSKYRTLNFNIGIEGMFVSEFYAYDYRPELNSFSAQNRVKTYGKPVISPFVNGQLKNFSFWMKYVFVNQFNEKGYFTTPNYTGLPQTFVFGINWMLYE